MVIIIAGKCDAAYSIYTHFTTVAPRSDPKLSAIFAQPELSCDAIIL